jgi:hypothetical protein
MARFQYAGDDIFWTGRSRFREKSPYLRKKRAVSRHLVLFAGIFSQRAAGDAPESAGIGPQRDSSRRQRITYARSSDFQEAGMVADSNSQIAWHRAQIRKHRAALKQIETARHNFGEIAGSKTIAQSQKTVTELKRKIRDSERIIAAYEKQTRRPLTTDFHTLASAPWSKWNGSDSPGRR